MPMPNRYNFPKLRTVTLAALLGSAASIAQAQAVSYTIGATADEVVTVDGTAPDSGNQPSPWLLNVLRVGPAFDGTLSVIEGGSVTASSIFVTGRDAEALVDVDGAGSTVQSLGEIVVEADGRVEITNGGSLTAATNIFVGRFDGQASLLLSGEGAVARSTEDLFVGSFGNGRVTIEAGARYYGAAAAFGLLSDDFGQVVLEGQGARMELTGALRIGIAGEGQLQVRDGANVRAATVALGTDATGDGTLEVTGESTQLLVMDGSGTRGQLSIGQYGAGILTISNGGSVTAGPTYIAQYSDSSGSAVVAGAGSRLDASSLRIGVFGTGDLGVNDGARLVVGGGTGQIEIAYVRGASGTLSIGGAADEEAGAAGQIEAGTIRFGGGAGRLVFNHTDSHYVLGAAINGNGAVDVLNGTTVLTGNSAILGTTTVSGGALAIDGRINNTSLGSGAGAVVIEDGGLLTGSGRAGAVSVLAGGTLSPGRANILVMGQEQGGAPGMTPQPLPVPTNFTPATFTVDAVKFADGAIFEAAIAPDGSSDLLVVNNGATLGAGAILHVTAGSFDTDGRSFDPESSFTVMDARFLSGTFGQVINDFAFLDIEVGYPVDGATGRTSVVLTTTRTTVDFGPLAETENQAAVGEVLTGFDSSNPLINAAFGLTEAEVPGVLNALTGDIYPTTGSVLAQSSLAALGMATRHSPDAERFLWAEALAEWGQMGSDGNAGAAQHGQFGLMAGYDAPAGSAVSFGAMLGVTRTSLSVADHGSETTGTGLHIGAYGAASLGGFDLRFGGLYSHYTLETRREVTIADLSETLSGSYSAQTIAAYAELSRDIALPSITLAPYLRLDAVDFRSAAFSETGGDAALSVSAQHRQMLQTTLGLRASTQVDIQGMALDIGGQVGWQHRFGDLIATSAMGFDQGAGFDIGGLAVDSDALVIGAHVLGRIGEMSELSLEYNASISAGGQSHSVNLSFVRRF